MAVRLVEAAQMMAVIVVDWTSPALAVGQAEEEWGCPLLLPALWISWVGPPWMVTAMTRT